MSRLSRSGGGHCGWPRDGFIGSEADEVISEMLPAADREWA
jgi:hypothetical protein